jgi:hypothetical protein
MLAAEFNVGIYIGSIVVALVFAFVCSSIAANKGHGRALWFVLGFFFSCIALVVVLLLPPKNRV